MKALYLDETDNMLDQQGLGDQYLRIKQFDPSQMKPLCLDEADNMLDQQGLGDQLSHGTKDLNLKNRLNCRIWCSGHFYICLSS